MFKFFKRSTPPAAAANAAAAPARRPAGRPAATVPPLAQEPPLPEVVEGNEQTDWALWEDSVMVLDSQMQGLTPSARIYEREQPTPSEYQELDPFSRIGKKSP